MNHVALTIALAAALFAAFVIGWLAAWISLRPAARKGTAVPFPVDDPARLAAEAEATAARDQLREALIEIEELRAYIDRKLARPAD